MKELAEGKLHEIKVHHHCTAACSYITQQLLGLPKCPACDEEARSADSWHAW